ncbi:putative disease resistance protein RGA3 [Cornus florida]|uniref:putative disease resistance protein RGA3 n=1 Tax=Cornus florida TaxID=4283 RepID=UPI00289B948B|nr:putative disease resistance protein RGA3 [Cornus florida]XP_059653460.1 putative disease resistance protein RGA3 [Cornus florida]
MAETILYNTVTEILEKLGLLVLQEIGLLSGAGNELDKLKDTVSTIRAVLVHVEEQEATNPEVADWLDKLNNAFCDADDLLDDFSTEVLRRQVMTRNKSLQKVRNFFSSSNRLVFSSNMANEIKAIRERLAAIAEDRKNFHLIERPVEMRVENARKEESHSFVHAESVIGRDDDKNKIVELLLDSNVKENVSVVAIVGMGGLGKTTLAQLVYNDEDVTKYFELKMWVCVSDAFDVKLIAQKIIGSETGKVLQMEELQNHLRTKIDGKKYLLVMDDVWNENRENWLKLRDLLMGGSRGSKILITTRTELVANVTRANSPYVLEGLSGEESWSLFKQMAFKEGEELVNPCRVTMGKEIVQKCRGVPLAIRAIGGLLYSKDTDAEWLLFKNNDLSKVAQEEDVIFPILKLSYDYLPSNLKRCFAFCSLYLKDEQISKQELIRMWIAHGFIHSVYEDQQLEDVGDFYFMDLLRRSLFQDVQRDKWGDIISCKMHDLVHDLAEFVVRPKSSVVNFTAENISERTRHLSLDLSWEIPTDLFRAHKLRTLKGPMFGIEQVSDEFVFERIVSTFKRLRVLDLSHSKITTVPNNLGKLKHLRYLGFSSDIETLPSSITKLQNLQTLKLYECVRLKELPRDINKLVSLRHLELDKCNNLTGMPCGLGELTHLLTLTRFVADSSSQLSELQNLNNLRGRLSIMIRGHTKGAAEGRMEGTNYLEAKEYLKILELDFHRIDDELEESYCWNPYVHTRI